MKPLSDSESRELDQLLDALCNRCIDEASRGRLAEILAANDDACRRYVEVLHLCVGISYLSGIGAENKASLAQNSAQHGSIGAFPALELPASDLGGFPTGVDQGPSASNSSNLLRWLFDWRGLTFVAALIFLVAAIANVPNRNRSVELAGKPQQSPAEVFDARTLRIDSGSARISLPQVGYMLIDGPAEVDLIGPLRAKLNRGRIRVRVTEESGHGFVVETPDGDVADLGTEFGLNVADGKKTGVVVFDGEVDLFVKQAAAAEPSPSQRLVGGEGVTFDKSGELNRIVSITTGQVATFQPEDEPTDSTAAPVIAKISDSLHNSETKKFYEIVPGGFRKDAVAYVDRTYEWKRISGKEETMGYLEGADYVKMFNDDKLLKNIEIQVTLSQPAKLYVLFDNRVEVPDWLKKDYRKLKDGLQLIGYNGDDRVYCRFNVWERTMRAPGVATLGPCNAGGATHEKTSMYAVAAVALKETKQTKSDK